MTVIERYPSYVPALSKLKEIYLEEGNREGARQQMAQLVKSHLGAGDGAAAGEALAELKRFDPNCREAMELSSIGRGTGATTPRSGMPAQKAAPSEIGMTGAVMEAGMGAGDEAMASSGFGSNDDDVATIDADSDEREPTRKELEAVDAHLGRGSREEAVKVLRQLALECGSHPEIVSRMKAAVALPSAGA